MLTIRFRSQQLFILISVLLAACTVQAEPTAMSTNVSPFIEQAITASPSYMSAEVTPLPPAVPIPQLTQTPANLAAPPANEASTSLIQPSLDCTVARQKVILRNGPGNDYPLVMEALRGEALKAQARNADGTWLRVATIDGAKQGWLPLATVNLSGELESLAIVTDYPEPPPAIFTWQGQPVQRVCLTIKQEYPQKPADYTVPVRQMAEQLMNGIGLQAVEADGVCDAYLKIKLIGTALGAFYPGFAPAEANSDSPPKTYCYAGVNLKGFYELTAPRVPMVGAEVNTSINPPNLILECNTDPSSATYEAIWAKALLEIFSRLWNARVLSYALHYGDANLFEQARLQLIKLGPTAKDAIPGLLLALQDEQSNETVRLGAVEALGSIGAQTPEVVPVLIRIMNEDTSWRVRGEAVLSLGKIGPATPQVIPALVQALNSDNSKLAIKALGMIGPAAREAIPALLDLMRVSWSRHAIAVTLESITGQKLGEDYEAWLMWWQKQNK